MDNQLQLYKLVIGDTGCSKHNRNRNMSWWWECEAGKVLPETSQWPQSLGWFYQDEGPPYTCLRTVRRCKKEHSACPRELCQVCHTNIHLLLTKQPHQPCQHDLLQRRIFPMCAPPTVATNLKVWPIQIGNEYYILFQCNSFWYKCKITTYGQ